MSSVAPGPPLAPPMQTGQSSRQPQIQPPASPNPAAAGFSTQPVAPPVRMAPVSTTPPPYGSTPGGIGPGGQPVSAAPAGISPSAWYGYTQVDSSKPLEWWQAQDQYYDPSATGYARYRSAKLDQNGKPIEGLFEHPDACPEGTTAYGHNQCLPTNDSRVNGGGANSPWGGGPGGWGMSPAETDYLTSVADMAKTLTSQSRATFDAGFPSYVSGLEYWKKASGQYGRAGVQNATAPAAGAIAENYKGARAQVRNLRGADKAAAESELARQEAGQISNLAPQEQAQAAQALTQGGEFGVSSGQQGAQGAGQLYGQAAGTQAQKAIAALNASNSWNIASLQANVSREALAQQSQLAWAQFGQHGDEFNRQLAQQGSEFDQQLALHAREIQNQQDAQNSSFWGNLFGTVANVGLGIAKLI